MTTIFPSVAAVRDAAGRDLGVSGWVSIDQERIDRFADATGDHQWIHVDPERAAAGPFGTTIAHGFLTLSLLPALMRELYRVDGAAMAINIGLDKVRFINPVTVGSRVRGATVISDVTPLAGAVNVLFRTTIEIDGHEKPAAIVESIIRYVE